MKIDVISAIPDLLESPFNVSMIKRAQDKNLAEITVHNLREYGIGNYKQIDDTQFGGGAGMVLMCEPLSELIEKLSTETKYDEIIFMTPDGDTFNQKTANKLSLKGNLLIICGHYKGIDERIREKYVTQEISVGDYVLTGGELAAAIVVDAVVRLLPGVLGDETSALLDSFQDNLLSPPVYTRPRVWDGMEVPEILLSGNSPKIEEWRMEEALKKTKNKRPDLLEDE